MLVGDVVRGLPGRNRRVVRDRVGRHIDHAHRFKATVDVDALGRHNSRHFRISRKARSRDRAGYKTEARVDLCDQFQTTLFTTHAHTSNDVIGFDCGRIKLFSRKSNARSHRTLKAFFVRKRSDNQIAVIVKGQLVIRAEHIGRRHVRKRHSTQDDASLGHNSRAGLCIERDRRRVRRLFVRGRIQHVDKDGRRHTKECKLRIGSFAKREPELLQAAGGVIGCRHKAKGRNKFLVAVAQHRAIDVRHIGHVDRCRAKNHRQGRINHHCRQDRSRNFGYINTMLVRHGSPLLQFVAQSRDIGIENVSLSSHALTRRSQHRDGYKKAPQRGALFSELLNRLGELASPKNCVSTQKSFLEGRADINHFRLQPNVVFTHGSLQFTTSGLRNVHLVVMSTCQ